MLGFLKTLTSISGVSGSEDLVREYIHKILKEKYEDIVTDPLGNLLVVKKGRKEGGFLLSAHMDEVGIIITHIKEDGSLKFETVGGIESRVLPAKHFFIGEDMIPGVVGIKPIHLQEKDEFEKFPELKNLYLDIGSSSKDETEKYIKLGDTGVFDSDYIETEKRITAKALDDRAGCAILLELAMNSEIYKYDIYFAFTTMEEIGTRGSKTVAAVIPPQKGIIVVEGTTCADVPGIDGAGMCTRLGCGPVLTIMDKSCISDRVLNGKLAEIAGGNGIDFQYKTLASGGNDAASYQTAQKGFRTSSVSVPCRYLHSPFGIMCKKDITGAYKLIDTALRTEEFYE
ncbi:MAG: M28 family peptidase [Clostridiales bacterium]|jgi:endoglucanase|nr:M28 family peptidase [Clostridiales bacterium]